MACPYFVPVEPDPHCSPGHATLPLGDAWSGLCHAAPETPWQPGADTLYPLCNIGYARLRCPHFPAGDGPDAVRFSVSAAEGSSLRLSYVVERDHLPFAHGVLEYAQPKADPVPLPPMAAVGRLAQAYISSYFRRRNEAPSR
jgi:hypothetical protein